MHIPDGFLDVRTCTVAGALAAGGVATAAWQTRRMPPRRVPLMGVSAAFVFAAQMLNFPVAGGTSGHLLGGVLIAALLGPSAAILVLTAVLFVQCFMFADGGHFALGANILNMGIVDSVGGYLLYRGLERLMPGPRGRIAAVSFAAWFGAVLASAVCAGELAASGNVPARVGFPAMIGVHALIGIGEAVITAMVLVTLAASRPELISPDAGEPASRRATLAGFCVYAVLIALALAAFVSPFASQAPDGLDRVSEKLGFSEKAQTHSAPIADYRMPWVRRAGVATAIAGIVGTGIAFGLCFSLAYVLVPRTSRDDGGPPTGVDPGAVPS